MADTGTLRSIGGLVAEVTVKEQGRDELTITSHPVERGAAITDHAFKNPAMLTVQAGWSAAYIANDGASGSLSDLYEQLLLMQSKANLIEVQTSKRRYKNMLIKAIGVDTDVATEAVIMVTVQLQEIILVDTLETTMPPNRNRAAPDQTSGVANTGTKSAQPSNIEARRHDLLGAPTQSEIDRLAH